MNIIISFSILFGCLLFNTSSVLSDNQIEENNQKTFLLSWRTTQLITLCMQPMMNLTKFENELQTSKVEGNLTEFFTSQCLIKDPLQHCVEQKYTTYFGQSVTNIEIRERNFNSDLIRDIIKYHCSNQGLIILTSYFNNIEYNCVDHHISLFQSCFQMTLKNDSFIENNSNEVNCAGIKVVQHCVSFNLQHSSICNGIEISTYINGLLNKIFDDNICKNRSDETVLVTTERTVTTERIVTTEEIETTERVVTTETMVTTTELNACRRVEQLSCSREYEYAILPLCDSEEDVTEEIKFFYSSKVASIFALLDCYYFLPDKSENLTRFFKSFCSQQITIIQCFVKDFSGNEYAANYLAANLQFISNQMSYLCHDEGRSLAYINDSDDGISCLKNRASINNQCLFEFKPNEFESYTLSQRCSYYRTLFDCIVNEHQQSNCETGIRETILFEKFFNTFFDEHLCKNIPKCRLR